MAGFVEVAKLADLECPLRGAVFDVRSGEVLNPPTTRRSPGVNVEGAP